MVEKNQMSEIMEEQGLQDSSCTSQECAAKIGNILGVQKMVTASFGKIEDTYTIEARLFTVESGETEKIVSKTSDLKEDLDAKLKDISKKYW